MTTPGWYPDPAGTPQQRYFDGANWTEQYTPGVSAPPPPPKKGSARKIILGVVGAIVLLVVITSVAGGNDDSPTASSDRSASAPVQDDVATAPGIGAPVSDGKFEFVVTSVDRSKTAGDPTNEFLQETAQGEFVNVHLTVRNTGDQAQQYFASNQKLVVGGKQFDAASIMGVPGDMTNINPGLAIDTVVSFDVLPGSSPEAIELHDSAFSGGVSVKLS